MRRSLGTILLGLILGAAVSLTFAGELPSRGLAQASGRFQATDACSMLQSKRKATNPGDLKTRPGETYQVREVIMANGAADWVRIDSRAAVQEPLRWVEARCGQVVDLAAAGGAAPAPPGDNGCHVAETYDSHVLALSWQPGFCEKLKPELSECQTQTPDRFDATHFALHGLWPNKRGCGHDYGYCGAVSADPGGDKCNYPALTMDDGLREQLAEIMPSVKSGTCLERHEYWKHGSCRGSDPNGYFRLAAAMTSQINASTLVRDLFKPNIGKTVSRAAFDQAFDEAFGPKAHTHVSMNCRAGFLIEMQIALPKEIGLDTDLATALQSAATLKQGSCDRQFFIDAAGLGTR